MANNNITLYLLDYNNYYNRIVKRYDTIAEYLSHSVYTPLVCNFNPADGIDTEHIFNIPTLITPPAANYVVAVDENNEIVSRWFITNSTRLRGGQYKLALHRDLVADFKEAIIKAPAYVERAMLTTGSPFIFNKEGMNFNQIKRKEVLLKDKSATPWIVGYLASDYTDISDEIAPNGNITAETDEARQATYSASYKELRDLGTITSGATINNQTASAFVRYNAAAYKFVGGGDTERGYVSMGTGEVWKTNWVIYGNPNDLLPVFDAYYKQKDNFFVGLSRIKEYVDGYVTSGKLATYKQYIGNAILNTDYIEGQEATNGPKYFYFKMEKTSTTKTTFNLPVGSREYNEFKQYLQEIENATPDVSGSYFAWEGDTSNNKTFSISFPSESWVCSVAEAPTRLSLTTQLFEKSGDTVTSKKQNLQDAPYIMFCAPYNDVTIRENGTTWKSIGTATRNIVARISTAFGGGGATSFIYDLQLLPYCPLQQIINENGEIDMDRWGGATASQYSYITETESSAKVGMLLFPSVSSFSFTIDLDEPVVPPVGAIEFKVDAETKFCRLVSPNYAGAFEFTPAKNGGVSSFEVNATYKPFQPYLHINPVFNNGFLYGGDFNDNRGLVCGGDFSLPQITDSWVSYQIQNRSYMEAHLRDVENLETTFRYQKGQAITSGVINSLTAGISGGMTGALVSGGNPIAAAGVAAGAAVLSGLGAAQDMYYANRLHEESKDYLQDRFEYNNQNIKALPTTMSRTSSFDINNKLFPFVEFYTATEVEENALRAKMKYNSMTVMAIGTIEDYIQADPYYISAQIIRFDEMNEDYHLAAAIANEIHKGVYI